MKILITGGDGLVGSHFVENYNPAPGDEVISPTREQLDITNSNSVKSFFGSQNIDAIVHFAAYTDMTKAEEQRDDKNGPSWIINVEGTANLIKHASKDIYFIHFSTDSVFSGMRNNPGPYNEDHAPEDNRKLLSWYGWTKREAEMLIKANLKNYAIIRISNPARAKYDLKLDYVRKILNLFDTQKIYPMFDDQYLTLTFIDEVTKSLNILLQKRGVGIFHISSTNSFTPYTLANFLIERSRGIKDAIKSTSIQRFLKDNPLRYPQFGGLGVKKTEKLLNLKFNTWEETVISIIKQLST